MGENEPVVVIDGVSIAIENVMGSTRQGVSKAGVPWSTTMRHDYGDIVGTVGLDMDPLDVFLGPLRTPVDVYVINQVDPDTQEPDEEKVMLGFGSIIEAREAYLSNYDPGWQGLGGIMPFSWEEFKAWLATRKMGAAVAGTADNATNRIGMQDAIQVSEDSGQVVVMADAAGTPLRFKVMASLAGVRNLSGRLYTAGFLRAVVAIADAECRESPMYGEEPHPVWDTLRGQWLTDSTREWGKAIAWFSDAAGNAWAECEVDESTERGARIAAKVRRKEKIPVSVRWFATGGGRRSRMTDGTAVTMFDAEHVPFVKIAALDHVPNPAFRQAGSLADSDYGLIAGIAMLDATNPEEVEAARFTPEGADGGEPAPVPVSADDPATEKEDRQPLADATHMETEEEKKKREAEEAAARAAASTVPAAPAWLADAASVLDQAKAIVADNEARKKTEATKAEIRSFADSVSGRTVEGFDLTRFSDTEIDFIVKPIADAESVDAAKSIVTERIEILDGAKAVAGLGDSAKVAATNLAGKSVKDGEHIASVHVMADAADKTIGEFSRRMNEAFDAIGRDAGIVHNDITRKRNRPFVDKMIEYAFPGNEGKRALADSAEMMLTGKAPAGMADSVNAVRNGEWGMLDAASNSIAGGNLLNQPIINSTLLERMYQDLDALPLCQGFSPDSFTRPAGSDNPIGAILRIPTVVLTPAPHDYHTDLSSLEVAESAAIPEASVQTAWQDFGTRGRKLGFSVTSEAELQLGQGPLHMDLVARNFYEVTNEFRRSTDLRLYGYMNAASDEISTGVVPANAAETVAAGDIAYNAGGSCVQDGIAYGSTVVAVVQPACGGNVSGAQRINTLTNPSANSAYRTPVVQPRYTSTINSSGVKSDTQINPIVVKLGSTTLVRGWIGPDGNIGSFQGQTADYAVDWATGKFVFNAHSGVTSGSTTLTLAYTYSTNFDVFQINFAAGYPDSQAEAYYFNQIFRWLDQNAARMSQYPNYAAPNLAVCSNFTATWLENAAIFYKFLDPPATERLLSGGHFARRNSVDFVKTNAPVPWGDNTFLYTQLGATKYGAAKPFGWKGPFPKYNVTNGNSSMTDEIAYYANEFSTMATPLPTDANGKIYNPKLRKQIMY